MEDKKFEKTRKGVEIIFDIIFLLNLFSFIGAVIFRVLFLTGVASNNIVSNKELIIYAIVSILLYIPTRLARNGHILAGIIGIIIALMEIIFAGLIWKIVGILLLIDSIVYIVNYKK